MIGKSNCFVSKHGIAGRGFVRRSGEKSCLHSRVGRLSLCVGSGSRVIKRLLGRCGRSTGGPVGGLVSTRCGRVRYLGG